MFEIIGFWIFVSIFTALLVLPIWMLGAYVIAAYAGVVYKKAFCKDDTSGREFRKSLHLKLVKPFDRALAHFGLKREYGIIHGFGAFLIVLGCCMWFILSLAAFIRVTTEVPTAFEQYGYAGAHVHHIAEISAFCAAWLTTPVLILVIALLGHALIVGGIAKVVTFVSKVNKVVNDDTM